MTLAVLELANFIAKDQSAAACCVIQKFWTDLGMQGPPRIVLMLEPLGAHKDEFVVHHLTFKTSECSSLLILSID